MKCPFCFEDIPDGSLFCPMCGKALPEEIKAEPCEVPLAPAPVFDTADECPEGAPETSICENASENISHSDESPDAAEKSDAYEKSEVVFPGRDTPQNYFASAAANATEVPYGAPPKPKDRNEYSAYPVASLVTALVNAVCFLFLGVPFSAAGIIFAVLGLKSRRRGMSIAALVLNGVCVIVGCILLIAFTVMAVNLSTELY